MTAPATKVVLRGLTINGQGGNNGIRVQAGDGRVLATQLYLPDDPGNRTDFLFARLGAEERAALGIPALAVAELLPPIEAVMVRKINEAMAEGQKDP